MAKRHLASVAGWNGCTGPMSRPPRPANWLSQRWGSAWKPRHGYELMRALEEQTGGSYSPSPGVIYPTLAWLEDMGYAQVEEGGGRKSYRITPEGDAFHAV